MGDLNITLDGDDVPLRCTPMAMKELCARHGSLIATQQKVSMFDFGAMVDVVEAGIGSKQLKHLEINRTKLETAVYEAGLATISAPITRFILMLANGGKEPVADDDGTDDEGTSGNA